MKRLPELDGIRGVAALVVVGFHLAPRLSPQGWMGVDCFFVLSGYLITTILLANRASSHYFKNFYVRRSLRIWPIYYMALFAVIALYRVMPTRFPIDKLSMVQFATYTQNIQHIWGDARSEGIKAFSHTWTLALEEQFYLIWPLVVWLVPRAGLFPLCAAVAASAVVVRGMGMSWDVLPARCDGFAWGAMIALIMTQRPLDTKRRELIRRVSVPVGIAATLAAILFVYNLGTPEAPSWLGPFFLTHSLLFMFLNISFAALVAVAVADTGRPWLAIARNRVLVYLGTVSYGIYLYHVPVLFGVEAVFRKFGSGHPFDGSRPLYRGAIELTITLIVASLSWFLIEKPILKLKDRFNYRGGTPDRAGTTQARPGEA